MRRVLPQLLAPAILAVAVLAASSSPNERQLAPPRAPLLPPPKLYPEPLTPDSPLSNIEVAPGDDLQVQFRCFGAPADALITLSTFEQRAEPILLVLDHNVAAHDAWSKAAMAASFSQWLEGERAGGGSSSSTSSYSYYVRAQNVPRVGGRLLVANVQHLAEEVLTAHL
eukprot:g3247.t1